MNSIQATIDQILADRRSRLQSIEKEKRFWDDLAADFGRLSTAIQDAVRLNRDSLSGIDSKVQNAATHAQEVAKTFQQIFDRFGRNDICIGIGGAGRMGKSTFLQSVTGLGEDQIPTSDMYYTTAGRSLIVNATQPIAIADMHTEATFLKNVIAPMCDTLKVPAPESLVEFQRIELPEGQTQAEIDIINRLEDTRRALPTIREELTGEKGRRIQLADLRDYVAYPDGGQSKAGKFMAVANIVIYAPFPQTEVKQLRVVDLPGLGEAGRNLAEIQTKGMSDICDITLLMKRPDDKNVSWNLTDTNALDAMKESSPLVKDQTMYTAILANVNGEKQERADACVDSIRTQLSKNGRDFRIIRCNAKDRDTVLSETMPEVLSFLAKNLPEIDHAILAQAESAAEKTRSENTKTLLEVKDALSRVTRASNGSATEFPEELALKLLKALEQYAAGLRNAAEQPDEEWIREVQRVTDLVKAWISNGCGYGSRENLIQKISDELLLVGKNAQPNRIVNHLRIAFRKQWELTDEHLQTRIGSLLEGFIKAIQSCTNSFVPPCEEGPDHVEALRKQLNAIAKKILDTPDQEPGDDVHLNGLAAPFRRLSEFDLKFCFHVEPTLVAATEVLAPNKLPDVKDYHDAEMFANKVMSLLTETADEYSKTLIANRTSDKTFGKKVRLIEGAVKDSTVREELIAMLKNANAATQSFSPNKIFAAVIDNTVDAMFRFDGSNKAFQVMVRGNGSELREKPTPKVQAALNAYAEISGILKRIR